MYFSLILLAFCVALFGSFILRRIVSLQTNIAVCLVKVAIPLIYFAFFYGTWTLLDDIAYFNQGKILLEEGYNPFTILFNQVGIDRLITLSGGHHIIYGWWNLLAGYLFGTHYYSAVFFNVGLTFIAGYFLYLIVQKMGFGRIYAKWLMLFFLLHWDILAWSSFLNLKDILVLTLTVITFYNALLLFEKFSLWKLLSFIILLSVFWWIRFYIPVFILLAFVFYLFYSKEIRKKHWAFMFAVLMVLLLIISPKNAIFTFLKFAKTNILYGIPHYLLTPRPWGIEDHYSFLLFPSILHWLLFIPSLIGGLLLWRRNKKSSFFLIYFLLLIFFYGFYEELRGPRQRVGVDFIIIWMQFHFLWVLLQGATRNVKIVYHMPHQYLRENQ